MICYSIKRRAGERKREKGKIESHLSRVPTYFFLSSRLCTLVYNNQCIFSAYTRQETTLQARYSTTMRSTGYGGLLDCSWYDIENCLQQTESDFQRMGKLGGGQRTSLSLTIVTVRASRYLWRCVSRTPSRHWRNLRSETDPR